MSTCTLYNNWFVLNPISRSIFKRLFNKDRSTICKSPEETTRSLFPAHFFCPAHKTKFPEKFHFNTASKIYLSELLVNAEAPDISLLDNPNTNLYFNFGEYAKPSNFNRDLLINIEADGLFRPQLIFQPVVAKV